MDLSVKIGDVILKSPVIASSCVDGKDGERIKKIAGYKLGAATTKTIVADPQVDPLPNIKSIKSGMLNCVFGTNTPARRWFEHEMKIALEGGIPVIANMAGVTPEESVELAKGCEAAGATIIEYPSACPHMAGILEAMYPGAQIPLPEVHCPDAYAEGIKAIKKAVRIPVIAKLSAIHHYNVKEWAAAVAEAGADAIAAADTIGPAMGIDAETAMPLLGGPRGYGGLSGPAIKPLVLRMVLEISETVKIPVIGIGGITSGIDAVEYILAGASAVGIATSSNLKGPKIYAKIYDDLVKYMERKGYTCIADFRGLTLERIKERKDTNKQIIHQKVVPSLVEDKCTACGVCAEACVYEAITVEEKAEFAAELCQGCGLCVTVCPTKAIVQNYY